MPTYEYRCAACGRFETFQKITEEPLGTCPTCGGDVERLISRNVNIIFKGSGFYVTDNRTSESNGAGKGAPAKETGGDKAGSAAGAGESTKTGSDGSQGGSDSSGSGDSASSEAKGSKDSSKSA